MMMEIGVPILMGLLLEINAGTIALFGAAAVIHELTAFWDVSYATSRRLVKPREQHRTVCSKSCHSRRWVS